MLNTIQETVNNLWTSNRKTRSSASGWVSGNAVCCPHNGESVDTRGRGGVISNGDGHVSYACFNCNFKTGYQPGRHLTYKFRKLLGWLGADENTIRKLVIDAVRIKDLVAPKTIKETEKEQPTFKARLLPEDAVNLLESQDLAALEYLLERQIDPAEYTFYTSSTLAHNLNRRLIIPCTWQNNTIGYTSRTWDPAVKPKYYSQYEPGYVFNVDRQRPSSRLVVVCEGPFDAMSIDGVAVLGNECSESQADIIDSLGKEVVVVPDGDPAGAKLIDQAIEYGWTVSFPVWLETCKDINEAVVRYGKLFALKSILDGRETGRLKIQLRKRKLYN